LLGNNFKPDNIKQQNLDGSGTGSFTSRINGLLRVTTYYVRAYAVSGTGTFYGNQLSFTTHDQGYETLSQQYTMNTLMRSGILLSVMFISPKLLMVL
jgi:hypothetical protein